MLRHNRTVCLCTRDIETLLSFVFFLRVWSLDQEIEVLLLLVFYTGNQLKFVRYLGYNGAAFCVTILVFCFKTLHFMQAATFTYIYIYIYFVTQFIKCLLLFPLDFTVVTWTPCWRSKWVLSVTSHCWCSLCQPCRLLDRIDFTRKSVEVPSESFPKLKK